MDGADANSHVCKCDRIKMNERFCWAFSLMSFTCRFVCCTGLLDCCQFQRIYTLSIVCLCTNWTVFQLYCTRILYLISFTAIRQNIKHEKRDKKDSQLRVNWIVVVLSFESWMACWGCSCSCWMTFLWIGKQTRCSLCILHINIRYWEQTMFKVLNCKCYAINLTVCVSVMIFLILNPPSTFRLKSFFFLLYLKFIWKTFGQTYSLFVSKFTAMSLRCQKLLSDFHMLFSKLILIYWESLRYFAHFYITF